MNNYANRNQGFNPNRAPSASNQMQAPVNVAPVNQSAQQAYNQNNAKNYANYQQNSYQANVQGNAMPRASAPMQQAQATYNNAPSSAPMPQMPQGQMQGQRQDFSNYQSQYQGGNKGGNFNRTTKKVYDRLLLNKFKELDARPDIEGAIMFLKDQLRSIKVAGLFAFEGIYFIKMPFDTYFQDYLKDKYHIAWYKHAKMWACNPNVAQALLADLEQARNSTLVMPDGMTYGFPQKKAYNNNYRNNYQQGNGGNYNNNYQQTQSNYSYANKYNNYQQGNFNNQNGQNGGNNWQQNNNGYYNR